MNTMAIDTFKIVKRLKEAGFTETQAETVSDVLRESRETDLQDIATKGDIKDARNEMALGFSKVHGEVNLLKWMQGAVLAGIVSLVHKTFFA